MFYCREQEINKLTKRYNDNKFEYDYLNNIFESENDAAKFLGKYIEE